LPANVSVNQDGRGGSSITFLSSHDTDGWYQCTAFNCAGTATTRARVQVEKPPEPEPKPPATRLDIPRTGRVIEPE